jgi:hypothetical protein
VLVSVRDGIRLEFVTNPLLPARARAVYLLSHEFRLF